MGSPAAPAADAAPFEQCLERLEALVARLESGELPLEEALAVFEEGVGLSRRCAALLEDAERRIEVLVLSEEGLAVRPLAPGAGALAGDDAE